MPAFFLRKSEVDNSGLGDAHVSKGAEFARRRTYLLQLAELGIESCRRGDWDVGIEHLSRVEGQLDGQMDGVSGLAESYLGYGLAREASSYEQGLKRCRAAVRREVWEAESYLNLARTYLLKSEKRRAISALEQGLVIDPDQTDLLALRRELGVRRGPPLPFLARNHVLNVFLGSLRHILLAPISARQR